MRMERVFEIKDGVSQAGLTRVVPECLHCQFGNQPVRLRRRWVHHFPDTGQIVVCEEKNLKRES